VATKATNSWWELAACRSVDPDIFFPISRTGPGQADVARAKAICAGCRIRRGCLDYAIDSHQADGVWGGTSEEERRLIAARRRDLERVPA
jgi:WhiB family transcriptional regulator, redox-sensing transcriptional regulator